MRVHDAKDTVRAKEIRSGQRSARKDGEAPPSLARFVPRTAMNCCNYVRSAVTDARTFSRDGQSRDRFSILAIPRR